MEIKGRAEYLGNVDDDCKSIVPCSFECNVTALTPGTNFYIAPIVSWERYDGEEWRSLSDGYWRNKRLIHYSANHGHTVCEAIGDSYHCKFEQHSCCSPRFDDAYRCILTGPRLFPTESRVVSHIQQFNLCKYEVIRKRR